MTRSTYAPYQATAGGVRVLADTFAEVGAAVAGPPALDPGLHRALVTESRCQRETSAWRPPGRPGGPGGLDQDVVRARIGSVARALLDSTATRELLRAVTGRSCTPGWSATCLTFYESAGSRLGPHRDKEDTCQFALLYYLEAVWPSGASPGGGLRLHIRAAADRSIALRVTARPNRLVILHGSRLTHFRPPLGPGESIAMLNGCFAIAG